MKRIFPIITVLITLSLLGLIFFQFLWLQSAHSFKLEQLKENITKASAQAGMYMMDNLDFIPRPKKNDLLFPGDKMPFEFNKYSVMTRYSREEIRDIVQKYFNQEGLGKIPFEFAVTQNSLTGDVIQTDNFQQYYQDSSNNINHAIHLLGPSGSNLENLTKDEWLVVIVPHQKSIVMKEMGFFIIGAILFTLIIIAAFFITIRTLIRQKKLSEIKSDFINNMTHEFKTPLATISLAVDALKNEKVVADRSKSTYFTGIIKEENIRMNKQVETILQAALLDKQEVQLNTKLLSAHAMINAALNNISLPLEQKGGSIDVQLGATDDMILADEVHFTNLINNLLDNALKYSDDTPHIRLSTQNAGHQLKIKIEDNGIGMNKDTLSRIFEKFYRAHTGNVHNVKGFGLGLSYVKKMVVAHKGTIKAESTLGKGSSFCVNIPLAKK